MEMELFVWPGREGGGVARRADCEKCLGKCIKFSFVQLRQRLSKLWRRARAKPWLWDAAVVDMADSPPVLSPGSPLAAAATATACWNFYEDARRVEFGAMPTPPFEYLSLLLFGATLSATNYLRQLSADWSYLRTALAPPLLLSAIIRSSSSSGCNCAYT